MISAVNEPSTLTAVLCVSLLFFRCKQPPPPLFLGSEFEILRDDSLLVLRPLVVLICVPSRAGR